MNEQWINTFKRMLTTVGYDDSEETVNALVDGLNSLKTVNGKMTLEYDDKTFTINSPPTPDELMFLIFNRKRK